MLAMKTTTLTWMNLKRIQKLVSVQYRYVSPCLDPQLFNMSEEQLDYYTKCFLHLQRKTQGQASLSGAVSGSDDKVVEFFRKSRLSRLSLAAREQFNFRHQNPLACLGSRRHKRGRFSKSLRVHSGNALNSFAR